MNAHLMHDLNIGSLVLHWIGILIMWIEDVMFHGDTYRVAAKWKRFAKVQQEVESRVPKDVALPSDLVANLLPNLITYRRLSLHHVEQAW